MTEVQHLKGQSFFSQWLILGIALARYTEEASDEDMLVRNADEAMYKAKSSGKNTFRFYSDRQ